MKEIKDLTDRVCALEYLLAQTMTVALRNSPDPESVLVGLQTMLSKKLISLGISPESGNKGFDAVNRIFTSVKESL